MAELKGQAEGTELESSGTYVDSRLSHLGLFFFLVLFSKEPQSSQAASGLGHRVRWGITEQGRLTEESGGGGLGRVGSVVLI